MAKIVRLTEDEQTEIAINAGGRNAIKERRGIPTRKISGKLTDLELHEIEVRGQFAVSKYFGVPMNWSITVGGNRAPHFVIKGISMRVQTPTHHPPILKLNRAQDFNTDLMIVCVPWETEPDVIVISGCVSQERFLREHSIQNFGEGERLVMRSWELTSIDDWETEAGLVPKKEAAMETKPPKESSETA